MSEENRFYFKQLLTGVHVAKNDNSARQMANFIYLIGDRESRECLVVDPAWDIEGLLEVIQEDDMNLVGALVTHYHPDHVGGSIFGMMIKGLSELMEKYPIPVYVNKHEADGLRQITGISESDMRRVDSEDTVNAGSVEVKCLHTPGHTPGSQCFRVDNCLVAGDTLFLQGCGRVDLPGGNREELFHTLTRRLGKIQDEIILFPGHNYGEKPFAPMSEVRETNSYLQIESLEDWLRLMS